MRRTVYIAANVFSFLSETWLQRKSDRYVICPYYHTVSDKPLPHVSPLYRHRTIAEFRDDLDWLTAHYTPIRWTEIDQYENQKKPAFCLTFDDGFKEFYTIVAPILEEKGIPCVNFLNSAFVDNKDMMFRNKEALQKQGIDWEQYLQEEQPYMTSQQILDLQARGFEFGSHSVDHPYFDTLPLPDQLSQTIDSYKTLRSLFPLPHRLFSYPFGQGALDSTALKVHCGTNEVVFGTANMRPARLNMYNRIWMEDTAMSAKTIIRGEYWREIAHRMLYDK